MYIAIEGVKGTGKSTLIAHLQPWLKARGISFSMLCPTQPMSAKHDLEQQALHFKDDDNLREQLYAARSNYHVQQTDFSQPLILGDRSIFTSFATRWQQIESMGVINYLKRVRTLENLIPYPDHVILLSLSEDVILNRIAARKRNYGVHDECVTRLRAAQAAYENLAQSGASLGFAHTQWHIIDAHKSVEDLVEVVGSYMLRMISGNHSLCA